MHEKAGLVSRLLLAGLLISVGTLTAGGESPTAAQSPNSFGSSTSGILIDAIVRDDMGVPVGGLGPGQFELREDGALQTITSIEEVSSRCCDEGVEPVHKASGTLRSSSAVPLVMGIVFEELGAEARFAAYRAALSYLAEVEGRGTFVGVFVVSRSLHVMLSYSNDAAAVRRALKAAAMYPGCPNHYDGDVQPAADAPGCVGGKDTRMRALNTFEALGALVAQQKILPGRKAIVLFSEGIQLEASSDVMPAFERLIAVANDAGVAMYSADAAGLRAHSTSAGARERMRTPFLGPQLGLGYQTLLPDDVMWQEPYVALSRLAKETGGLFVDNTNDVGIVLRETEGDRRGYYLLGYTPSNARMDNTYRRVSVRVRQPGATVRARAGYFASGRAWAVGTAEIAPLLLLDQRPAPVEFPLDVRSDVRADGGVGVSIRVANRDLTYREAEGRVRADLLIVFRVTQAGTGKVIDITSRRFDVVDSIGRAAASELNLTLDAGSRRSVLDVVAYDVNAQRASVRRVSLR